MITKLFADIEIKKKEMEKAEERDRYLMFYNTRLIFYNGGMFFF